ncbi:hypothetical protein [Altibacter sp. HG106]|uniref:hypothetical protein n=1 Tax=Altibacter sp. HG106 TaxID=3023937 RepID=UPI00234FE7D0|nr:hypothetical protein [Altibacter sp. HG106]MDC7994959.1 hypothetical protein [Altibacter sp. HG106]
MKRTVLICASILFFFSCEDDEGRTCTTCRSDQTANFELCREGNGNASVNGDDTNTPYDRYVEDLRETGVSCGGI